MRKSEKRRVKYKLPESWNFLKIFTYCFYCELRFYLSTDISFRHNKIMFPTKQVHGEFLRSLDDSLHTIDETTNKKEITTNKALK